LFTICRSNKLKTAEGINLEAVCRHESGVCPQAK
jgi:hypothetical protein